jgi:transcriptional regulator with XRE-family HTH domain
MRAYTSPRTTDPGPGTRVKDRELEGFGKRLVTLGKARGFTQEQLGEILGLSQRMVADYESQGGQPPGAILPDLARALGVSTDQILGVEPVQEKVSPTQARICKRLRKVEELPSADQKAVLRLVDALLKDRGIAS